MRIVHLICPVYRGVGSILIFIIHMHVYLYDYNEGKFIQIRFHIFMFEYTCYANQLFYVVITLCYI